MKIVLNTIPAAEVRDALHSDFSDAYKAAFGVRPRFTVAHLSDDELHARANECREMAARDAATSGPGWEYHGDAASIGPEPGTYAYTARLMAEIDPSFDWDGWKDEMKDRE